jgi:hypothetical protein
MSNEKVQATIHPDTSGFRIPEAHKEIHPDWLQSRADTTKLRRTLGITVVVVVSAVVLALLIGFATMGRTVSACRDAIASGDRVIAGQTKALELAAAGFGALGNGDLQALQGLQQELRDNLPTLRADRAAYDQQKETCGG